MTPVRAARLGEPGYVEFLHRLSDLGVIDRDERLELVAVHGAVLRAVGGSAR